ncbi:MAG: CCA tRNA nucleotidyltransferase, partial [Alphaproteobacteria bacterium]|nr:CCA tRNA nucleotidyltransferase [Alphaproteobacteria bacterium]
VETDGRHAKVEFTSDWDADAARRDFTFNAMSMDVDGTIHDPFGGADDLAQGRVRFVGDAATRIDEDVLRLLRYYRFYAHFGRPPADASARAACRDRAVDIDRLSGERVRAELLKLLAAPDPAPVLALMRDDDVLRPVIGVSGDVGSVARLVVVEAMVGSIDPLRRLFVLLSSDVEGVRAAAHRLKLSKTDRDFLIGLRRGAGQFKVDMDGPAIRRVLYRTGALISRHLVLLGWAASDPGNGIEDGKWRNILHIIDNSPVQSLPIAGADVLSLGVAPGVVVGNLLREVEIWWVETDFKAARGACLRYLESLTRRDTT